MTKQNWIVDFYDDEDNDVQHASFSSKAEAEKWIRNVEVQQRYEPTGFEVVNEPHYVNENETFQQSFNEDLKLVFESCNIASGRQPSFAQSSEKYDEVSKGNFAYDVVEKCLRSNMSLGGVWSADNNKHYVASIFGGNNGAKLDRRLWVSYLQEVEQMISYMIENGCGSVWLVDFINDPLDDAWELRIGFDLLSSPFRDDR